MFNAGKQYIVLICNFILYVRFLNLSIICSLKYTFNAEYLFHPYKNNMQGLDTITHRKYVHWIIFHLVGNENCFF